MEKYNTGVHTVKRKQIQLGPNSRVVTVVTVIVVNSIRAQGFILGINTPVLEYNTTDPRLEAIEIVRKSPALIQEIVNTGTLMCDAGQHTELAFR